MHDRKGQDDGLLTNINSFTDAVIAEPFPERLKAPDVGKYDKRGDPSDHIDHVILWMRLYDFHRSIAYCCFEATLIGYVKIWFRRLPKASIESWEQLQE